MSFRVWLLAMLLFAAPGCLLADTPIGAAAQSRTPLVATTQHRGRFNEQNVRYQATVAETFLKDADGNADASVVTTAYVRTDVGDATARPVMFLFNGGPGASSTPFHFDAFGPKRRVGEGAQQRMVDNPDSPLDAVDLVFIDPVGTGYSRPFAGSDGAKYWSRTGDARAVIYVIEEWLRAHGRSRSPRYLAGQSYGTVRAATILQEGKQLSFEGVLLFALVGNATGREMPYVVALPSFAATAWYHDRIDKNGRGLEQVFDAALEFARTKYVTALIQGGSLPPAEKNKLAQQMSSLIGLPADFIVARDLRISTEDFMFNLLRDQGLRTGQLDGRGTRRLDAPKAQPPYDDPGLGFTLDPVPPSSKQRPAATGLGSAEPPALESYFRSDLKFRTPEAYNSLNLDVNKAWNYEGTFDEGAAFDTNDAVAAAMRASPKLRLFWVSGIYDLTTPAYSGRYALDRAGVPGDRLTAVRLPGGHSVYKDTANRSILAGAVREFVRSARTHED